MSHLIVLSSGATRFERSENRDFGDLWQFLAIFGNFWHFGNFLAYFINFCLIKSDISGNTVCSHRKLHVFKNSPQMTILAFSTNFCPIKSDISGNTV